MPKREFFSLEFSVLKRNLKDPSSVGHRTHNGIGYILGLSWNYNISILGSIYIFYAVISV